MSISKSIMVEVEWIRSWIAHVFFIIIILFFLQIERQNYRPTIPFKLKLMCLNEEYFWNLVQNEWPTYNPNSREKHVFNSLCGPQHGQYPYNYEVT